MVVDEQGDEQAEAKGGLVINAGGHPEELVDPVVGRERWEQPNFSDRRSAEGKEN